MKEDAALLPCPFCGSKVQLVHSLKPWIKCIGQCTQSSYLVTGFRPASYDWPARDIVKWWNTRHQPERVSDKAQRFGGDAAPVAVDVQALKRKTAAQTDQQHFEDRGWNDCLDMLVSRNLLRQDSVAEMMERLPEMSSIMRHDDCWSVECKELDFIDSWVVSGDTLPKALRAALDKCGVSAKASNLGADALGGVK